MTVEMGARSPSPQSYGIRHGIRQCSPSLPQVASIAPSIAHGVSVRVLTTDGTGSGVLVARRGETYLVLSCHHVIANVGTRTADPATLQVLTADGRVHPAQVQLVPSWQGLDLALLEFSSPSPYPVVKLGNPQDLQSGDRLYAAGFPRFHTLNPNRLTDTRSWGSHAYQLTIGKFSHQLKQPLSGGYRLGYTNAIEMGMSGGPVLNDRGELVGINGRLPYPLQGRDAFQFADGSLPSEETAQQLEQLSWAIPVIPAYQEALVFKTAVPHNE